MSSIPDVFADLRASLEALGAIDWDQLAPWDRVQALSNLETLRRKATACATDIAASVDRCTIPELGGAGFRVVADVLRITPREASRRMRDAAQLQPRTTLTGAPVPPELPATAKAWNAGLLDIEHLRTIQGFIRDLPDHVEAAAVEKAEVFLADKATVLRPDQLRKVADRLALDLNPDGEFSENFRARQRGFAWCGGQRTDGMSVGKVVATPELRATIDALLAKFAAPGMCNPADQTPTVNGEPSQQTVDRDTRTTGQRQHDGLLALLRSQLGNPELGKHNGLPVTIIASATIDQICTAAGVAVTGGGTVLPMKDLIRMASHAYHYLCLYEKHSERPLYLGRTKRIATADQRIVLHHKDRGCTRPGCTAPGYLTEVHHDTDWAAGGHTNIDEVTLACKPDHQLLTLGGWRTRKLPNGRTEWIPPPDSPLPGGTNDYHHPERMLRPDDE